VNRFVGHAAEARLAFALAIVGQEAAGIELMVFRRPRLRRPD
jgi:hypothetical protein